MKKIVTLGATVAVAAFMLAACGNTGSKNSAKSGSNSSEVSGKVLAVGSTALQPLAEQAGAQFQNDNPKASVEVQGGGSGAGLSQVAAGSVQIGDSDIFAEQGKSIDASKLVDHKVAVVGMAPVVNKDAKVKNVSQQQLIDIFTGKITNWKQVGGADEKIVLVNRAAGSGTRVTFEQFGLKGAKPKASQEQDANGTVQKIVATTPGAISYLAFSYLTGANLQALSIDNVKPTDANVVTNDWKIWGYEHMYTNGEAKGATAAFLKYMVSPAIQNGLVKKLGYLPISDMKVTRDASGSVK
ncbi:phosphate ABC transporter substrate-binding protein [Periweissella ghanensis]|uniref:Phosphate-binding protein n=1 Tax=Periweissella ghanensis TaxID=467997 RepID=A0ABN8BNF4_9LACO|nr:phosphate ABC transporter substrate-binding protein [Periweissella ghanensis]MCM0600522.1 phosphate ABC transporter substrate-binding protein [Periweissella ghanensis]CAH0418268.1 Phosphate-binding protein PstS 1 [Periweissella ghanensis]